MIELINELGAASNLLHDALTRYAAACAAVQTYYGRTITLSGVPRALSDRVAAELLSVSSYETTIKQARSAISQASNYSTSITPIHTLPIEVLSRIFRIIVGARPCQLDIKDNSRRDITLPRYPDFLSQICSRWRQVTIGLPSLWSHIDIATFHRLTEGSITRASVCAVRAGSLPLDIHVRVPMFLEEFKEDSLLGFFRSAAMRIRSLELSIPDTSGDFDEPALEYCLKSCVPGILAELVIKNSGHNAGYFLEATDDVGEIANSENVWVKLPKGRFEDVLQSVTTLRLDGLYPLWTSQAYHGLEELHLTCKGALMSISKLQLYSIFVQSPRLRVVEFTLGIRAEPPEDRIAFQPARLINLEVLELSELDYSRLNIFLGLLEPCSKPLQLAVLYQDRHPLSTHEDKVVEFLKNSNITRLSVKATSGSGLQVNELFHLLPHLRVLAFADIKNRNAAQLTLAASPHITAASSFRLDVLYLLRPHMHLDTLCRIIETHTVQKLVVWDCRLFRDGAQVSNEDYMVELSRLCPIVEDIPVWRPCPILDWV